MLATSSLPAGPAERPDETAGEGTPELAWRDADFEASFPRTVAEGLVPPGSRAVVVAPHPDEGVLATGGLLALLAQVGRAPLIVSVTDGERTQPSGDRHGPERLAIMRRDESLAGLRELGVPQPSLRSLRLEVGRVAARERDLAARLRGLLRPTDIVFVPWAHDGHPDHEATHRAAAWACREVSAVRWDVPIRTWHWSHPGDPRVPWERAVVLLLDERAMARKQRAINAHRSQLEDDARSGREAAPPPAVRAHFNRDFEVFFRAIDDPPPGVMDG